MQDSDSIPIFVISLPGSSRFDFLKQQLTKFNIPFERLDAIDGSKIEENALGQIYDERRALRKIGRPLARGEIGNALSHRKAWHIILERNLMAALVLEDDAIIDQTFCSFLRTVKAIPNHVGFLSLYTHDGVVFRRPSATLGEFRLHAAALGLPSTVGYIIKPKYARRLLGLSARIEVPTDCPSNHLMGAQYLVFPMPVSHTMHESSIQPERAMMFKQRKVPRSLWPKWVPAWLRTLAYITCIVYLLRPDRYDGFADYFRHQVSSRLRFAMHDTVTIAQLGQ
jgi:glycosyl transferase, family 25